MGFLGDIALTFS